MLAFDYTMELLFGEGSVREHSFTLRCIPQETPAQHICTLLVETVPEAELSYASDGFGTRYCYGLVHAAHERFCVRSYGTAEIFPDRQETAPASAQILYRQFTGKTRPGAILAAMRAELDGTGCFEGEKSGGGRKNALAAALQIRDYVYHYMAYTPGVTTPFTTAEEAAAGGKGVCQDYVHIFLSLCRMCGISCRYTAGLLLGEGKSHAWAEICDGGEWISIDPTNPDSGREEKLVFSHGRDARDCEINRGVYLGGQTQYQKITAELANLEAPGYKGAGLAQ